MTVRAPAKDPIRSLGGQNCAIMRAPVGFMVLLGLVTLAGIVINNGILLIDHIGVLNKN